MPALFQVHRHHQFTEVVLSLLSRLRSWQLENRLADLSYVWVSASRMTQRPVCSQYSDGRWGWSHDDHSWGASSPTSWESSQSPICNVNYIWPQAGELDQSGPGQGQRQNLVLSSFGIPGWPLMTNFKEQNWSQGHLGDQPRCSINQLQELAKLRNLWRFLQEDAAGHLETALTYAVSIDTLPANAIKPKNETL